MDVKLRLLSIIIAATMITSGPVLAAETGNAIKGTVIGNATLTEKAIAAEINALMADGKSMEEAVNVVNEKYATAIKQNQDTLVAIYSAIAIAAEKSGINANSAEFAAAIAATSEKMINGLGISEEIVVDAAVTANIDITVVTATLPTIAADLAAQAAPIAPIMPRPGFIISNTVTSASVVASPAN